MDDYPLRTILGDTEARELPLFDSDDDYATATRRLIARKRYEQGGQADA